VTTHRRKVSYSSTAAAAMPALSAMFAAEM